MTHGVLVALKNNQIKLYDIYNNELAKTTLDHRTVSITGGTNNDDMYFGVLVQREDQNFEICEFNVTLEKRFSLGSRDEDGRQKLESTKP